MFYFWLLWVFIAVHAFFCSYSEWGPLFVVMHEFLTAVSSLVENGHWGTQAAVDEARGSLVSVLELQAQ